ncbi:MAG TPA: hypothetical protein PLS03_07965 [Terrimicrobiaceae bacterium]|nr:hypothetical protein [Terrimicrobiaceae bacterium]
MNQVTFQWIDPCPNARLRAAQQTLADSVRSFGLEPLLFPAGRDMVKFADILRLARKESRGTHFVWCNSDVILTKNPYDFADDSQVHGFPRTERPSGEVCCGIDMYLIPNRVWDDYLSKDVPDLYCGGATIDWWITRACQKAGIYQFHEGCIDHVTHPRSAASGGGDAYYRHNIRAYNAWARRNNVGTLDEYIRLPLLGAWNNSLRGWINHLKDKSR